MTSKLKIDGHHTQAELARIEREAENAIEFEATELGARAEVSRTGRTYSVGAFVQWLNGKGWGGGVKAKKTF